jgi:hypothetical protein
MTISDANAHTYTTQKMSAYGQVNASGRMVVGEDDTTATTPDPQLTYEESSPSKSAIREYWKLSPGSSV